LECRTGLEKPRQTRIMTRADVFTHGQQVPLVIGKDVGSRQRGAYGRSS
jgi:hypothetical protein